MALKLHCNEKKKIFFLYEKRRWGGWKGGSLLVPNLSCLLPYRIKHVNTCSYTSIRDVTRCLQILCRRAKRINYLRVLMIMALHRDSFIDPGYTWVHLWSNLLCLVTDITVLCVFWIWHEKCFCDFQIVRCTSAVCCQIALLPSYLSYHKLH